MRRFIVVVLLCIYLMPAASLARSSARSSARASKAHTRPADPVYTSALAAANRFLQAWQTQDHETGIMMLSDSARQHSSPELLDTFFSHTQAAYEVGQGRKMKEGTYAFPVVLFVMNSSKPRRCVLLVTRGGNDNDKDDWAIDKLP
jgi:hypothetical protein